MKTWLLVVAVLPLAGCDTGGEQGQVAKPLTPGTGKEGPKPGGPVVKPAESDPAAAAAVAKLLDKHTGGKPERIDRLRTHVMTRAGRVEFPGQTVEANWRTDAVWPDRYRAALQSAADPSLKHVMCLRGLDGWQLMPGPAAALPFGPNEVKAMVPDTLAEWAILLVPFREPNVVVVPEGAGKAGGKPVTRIRVWSGDRPPFVAGIDDETGLLAQVSYDGYVIGTGLVPMTRHAADHQPTDGVLLPKKVIWVVNGKETNVWTGMQVEAGATVAPTLFDPPK